LFLQFTHQGSAGSSPRVYIPTRQSDESKEKNSMEFINTNGFVTICVDGEEKYSLSEGTLLEAVEYYINNQTTLGLIF
jgi:hypothetical protein